MERISKAQVKWVRSLKLKKNRDELGLFVAEGKKCVEELQRYFELQLLITPENASPTEIEQMSGMKTPQGTIGVFKKHSIEDLRFKNEDWRLKIEDLVLVLDGVQDPGNLGTIIRTCDWFGVKDIVCSTDSADCYNPKVVQATMGALGRVRVHYANLADWIGDLRLKIGDVRIIGTLLEGEDLIEVTGYGLRVTGYGLQVTGDGLQVTGDGLRVTGDGLQGTGYGYILVMGSEGNGISPEVRALLTDAVRIPPYPANKKASDVVESLNVSIATAIILAQLRQLGSPRGK